ncbi:MFS transporter [Formosimonas limnophila]|uniref:MFS transporter n=1 Tax=Formosimonas limnophila TaxID=1384487 RepID=A0A8J3FY82_9BURK|nr:MFS transporter [Formosimonas limnophila]GHA70978.1 MFS transporter [Formosimonas limnophila]
MNTSPRAAQIALFTIFASFGVVVGFWAAAIPLLQRRLALSEDMLGMSIFCFGLGALLATFATPKYAQRHGTRAVMIVSGIGVWLTFPIMLIAPSIATLMVGLAALGACCGTLDASMNSHGFTVEHYLQKPTISLFHGGYSLGNILGSLTAALIIALGWGFNLSVALFSPIAIAALLYARRFCYAQDAMVSIEASSVTTDAQRLPLSLIVVAILTALCFFSEGAVGDWGGIFIRDQKDASPTQTALSLGAFAAGMTVARFLGDRLRTRFATLPLLWVSSLFSSLMMIAFLTAPNAILALTALVFAGLGYANIVPLLFVRAANIEGISAARGVSFAAGMGYASLLGGPALLGYVATHIGLYASFALVVVGSLIIAIESFLQSRRK